MRKAFVLRTETRGRSPSCVARGMGTRVMPFVAGESDSPGIQIATLNPDLNGDGKVEVRTRNEWVMRRVVSVWTGDEW